MTRTGGMTGNHTRQMRFWSRWHGGCPAHYYVEVWESPRVIDRLWRAILG